MLAGDWGQKSPEHVVWSGPEFGGGCGEPPSQCRGLRAAELLPNPGSGWRPKPICSNSPYSLPSPAINGVQPVPESRGGCGHHRGHRCTVASHAPGTKRGRGVATGGAENCHSPEIQSPAQAQPPQTHPHSHTRPRLAALPCLPTAPCHDWRALSRPAHLEPSQVKPYPGTCQSIPRSG